MLWTVGIAYAVRSTQWQLLVLYLLPAPPMLVWAVLQVQLRAAYTALPHHLHLLLTPPFTTTSTTTSLLPVQLRESPRFMLAKGWHAPATASLRRIAATNGASLPANLTLALPPAPSPRHGLRGKLGGFGELWHPALRARSALVGVAWFGSTSTYYGVVLAGGQPGDLYVRNALGAILELPAYVLMPVLGERWGRRRSKSAFDRPLDPGSLHPGSHLPVALPCTPAAWSFFLLVFTAAIAAVALCGGKLSGAWALVLSLLARFGAAGASTIVYVAAAEQWPTTCRNLGVGCGAAMSYALTLTLTLEPPPKPQPSPLSRYGASMGRLGSILAPLVGLTPYPTAVLAVVGGAAAAAALALPETQGKAIPETLGPASTGSLDHDTSPVSHVGVPREVPGLRAELPGEEPTSDLLREVDRTSSKNASTEELPSYPRR